MSGRIEGRVASRFELDPEVAEGINALSAKLAGLDLPAIGDIRGRRELMTRTMGSDEPLPSEVQRRDMHLTSFDGTEITARWYWKADVGESAAVVYLHGGGMVAGSVDIYDWIVCQYVLLAGIPMLSVGYRLAPEHPFPAPQEDSYAGLCWLVEHAEELGVDRRRIAVMGDSAGGGLAAAVALMARDREGPHISMQILIYASLDDRVTPDEHLLKAPYLAPSYEGKIASWNALLAGRAGAADVPAIAAPARLEDALELPAAYIEVGDVDILRAENLEYAMKLSAHGVPVELHVHPGCPHGYDVFAREAAVSRRAIHDRVRVLTQL
jgi:acetyl esterase/lipase